MKVLKNEPLCVQQNQMCFWHVISICSGKCLFIGVVNLCDFACQRCVAHSGEFEKKRSRKSFSDITRITDRPPPHCSHSNGQNRRHRGRQIDRHQDSKQCKLTREPSFQPITCNSKFIQVHALSFALSSRLGSVEINKLAVRVVHVSIPRVFLAFLFLSRAL